jgi:ubiquitin C-terminal hydrolase
VVNRFDKVKKIHTEINGATSFNVLGMKYNLSAFIEHHGEINGGHYTFYQQYKGRINHFDDDVITEISSDQFENSSK